MQTCKLLSKALDQGKTFLIGSTEATINELCSKYMPSVQKLLDRVAYVNDGRVVLKKTEGTTFNVVMLGEDP